ncbi:MAG: RagB/SusD family nutrient uptake outer membrane protein [Bacteroidaceae bacterium]|nr:RagB/SusD family nutrient uptake outer membrane protein [Bacteroidaceae bacterium]
MKLKNKIKATEKSRAGRRVWVLLFTAFLTLHSSLFISCTDFFESDLNGVADIDGRKVQQERDAFYLMNGILQLMQQAGDSYVIAGELRGDLVSQTENSTQELRDIEFFQADSTNSYLNERQLYAIVNNCNYFISALDKEYMGAKADTLTAEAKCIRAWAYLNLALDYGEVSYYTEPILSSDKSQLSIANYQLEQLLDVLISDLLPYVPADGVAEQLPFTTGQYSSINSYATQYLLIPVRWMLGELYMWKENFYEAAHMYYQLMCDRKLTVPVSYCNRWRNNLCEDVSIRNWVNQFSTLNTANQVCVIPFSDEFVDGMTALPNLFYDDYQLCASSVCRNVFENQQYTINLTAVPVSGDLRGRGVNSDYGSYVLLAADDDSEELTEAYITKYNKMNASSSNYVCLTRSAQVYLRYAEAINRLGLHRMALATLKYGLNANTLVNTNYIGKDTINSFPFTDFGQVNSTIASTFAGNGPLHSRGSGDADMNASFTIDTSTGIDSLTAVENLIMDEYVLECAFEGNRFHDLMRISQYRRSTDYLAKTVAAKLAQVKDSPRSYDEWVNYLRENKNWYLPSSR